MTLHFSTIWARHPCGASVFGELLAMSLPGLIATWIRAQRARADDPVVRLREEQATCRDRNDRLLPVEIEQVEE